MNLRVATHGSALLAGSIVMMLGGSSGSAQAQSLAIQQCINPQTNTVLNTDFCRCLGLVQDADRREWVIRGNSDPACLKDENRDTTASTNARGNENAPGDNGGGGAGGGGVGGA